MVVAFLDLPVEILLEITGYASLGDSLTPGTSRFAPQLATFVGSSAEVGNKSRMQPLISLRQ
jgi:hypothetical protein